MPRQNCNSMAVFAVTVCSVFTMCRGFFELYSIDNDRKYIDDIEKSMIHAWSSSCHQGNNLLNDDDLRGGTTKTSWEILHQGALVELYARLAVLERENR
ncbi:hypothetical protein NXX87_08890 [Bacteroides faecis]|uniref:hypothetical protein n=1 Tax=Bacteroides faecis TaxID=674529 RepID=UPI0021644C17|nr:hypothetical protein NXX87_08890 [Bacteroides faecis]